MVLQPEDAALWPSTEGVWHLPAGVIEPVPWEQQEETRATAALEPSQASFGPGARLSGHLGMCGHHWPQSPLSEEREQ